MKKVASILNPCPSLGGADGLAARTLFSYQDHAHQHSPFLRLNYAAPTSCPPQSRRNRACASPLRGFDVLTLVYDGEMEHRDSRGHSASLSPGDVQWLRAGSGLIHQARHSEPFARQGGLWHMVQLWINLPARAKALAPQHQYLPGADVPTVCLPNQAGQLRVIAGCYQGRKSALRSHSPLLVWDIRLSAGHELRLDVPEGWNTSLLLLQGQAQINQQIQASPAQVVVLGQDGQEIELQATSDSHLLLFSGEPIPEPVVGYGPFVMNTQQEITQAISDFDEGRFSYVL